MTLTLYRPTCDMQKDCQGSVGYIDEKGYVYCDTHGKQCKQHMRCRKLTPKELKRLLGEKQIERY